MGIQQNMAYTMRILMERQHKSLAEFSKDLEISRSSLQDYLKAQGNPSLATVEHLAEKMHIDPAMLLTGLWGMEQRDIILLLLETVQEVAVLPSQKKTRFAELILEVVQLWNDEP